MIRVNHYNGKTVEIEGPKRVREILKQLGVLENTVLVARGDELLTPDRTVQEGEEIELIPVISGGMKCKVCGQTAVISLPRHNSAFCRDHFFEFFYHQVKRGINQFRMFTHRDRILVCVSGGKDSLTLWYVLSQMGYNADGLYIDLGIGDYSEASLEMTEKMAETLDRRLIVIPFGSQKMPIAPLAKRARRTACSVCGTVKRYYFNRVALEEGYDVVATGHNLDDEVARLLGNILRWNIPFVAKQSPVLEEENGLRRKVKPLFRLTEQEIAAFAFLNRIQYIRQECPMSRDSTSLLYKRALNLIEEESPGTKHFFYLEFLKKSHIFKALSSDEEPRGTCTVCGGPSLTEVCSFCRLLRRIEKEEQSMKQPLGAETTE